MAKNKEAMQFAMDMYMKGYPQAKIAEILGKSENTISRWKQAHKWDDLKSAQVGMRDRIEVRMLSAIKRISDAMDDPDTSIADQSKLADMLAKTATSLERLKGSDTMSNYLHVFIQFGEWLMNHQPREFVLQVTDLQDQFLSFKMKALQDG